MLAPSETHFSGEEHHCEEGGGYILFWKGCDMEHLRLCSVGFSVRNEILPRLYELCTRINEWLLTVRFQTRDDFHATMISVYAPKHDADAVVKGMILC